MRDLAKVPARAARDSARDIKREIERSLDEGKDPYGTPFKRLATGGVSHLEESGAGRRSIRVVPSVGAGLKITVGLLRMIYHQFGGASHLRGPGGSYRQRHKNKNFGRDKDRSGGRNHPPRRSFLPFDKMPRAWAEIIIGNIEKAAAKVLKRG